MSQSTPGRTRVAVLISGAGTLMQALLEAGSAADAPFAVVAVLSDRDGAEGLEKARAAGVPTAVVALKDFDDRATWNVALDRALETFHPDLVVCAGFMKIIGEPGLSRYSGRMINTHPALLPAFPGAHGVRDALAAGVKVTGCSVIMVDAGTDSGPILAQRALDVRPDDDEASLHERIKVLERALVVEVVGELARGERVSSAP
ncbi:phosphoribosylglycinamide formyltransferase [Spongisporangium articulatum]|uniref:Phosphoribosylglycinamide formyltransferase n=1 Tax=Spongisporangium articulatum TaxID=3362603 RepID=A0ABW8ARJ2_9ACTN